MTDRSYVILDAEPYAETPIPGTGLTAYHYGNKAARMRVDDDGTVTLLGPVDWIIRPRNKGDDRWAEQAKLFAATVTHTALASGLWRFALEPNEVGPFESAVRALVAELDPEGLNR
jgi:hypothetical protein